MKRIEITRHDIARRCHFSIRPGTSDEKAILEVFKKNSYQRKNFKVGDGERWIDMGCNVGAFTVFAMAKSCDVISYEADVDNHELSIGNITSNYGSSKVLRAAIVPDSHQGRYVHFHVNNRPMALRRHSLYAPKKDYKTIEVPAIRFSEAITINPGHKNVKMNIEGAEIDILNERPNLKILDKLVLEWSFDKDRRISTFKGTLDYLKTQFSYVDTNRSIKQGLVNWDYYPPNAFIYCMK